ncbi:MAG: nuclear transport factor 2 family protein [Flammeovirgaceae bacterium]
MRGFFILVLCAAVAACSTLPTTNQNEKLAQEMFAAFNRHDWKGMAEYYADTAEFLDPSYGTEFVKKTRTETISKYAEMEKMFPNVHDEVVTIFSRGDKVAIEFISTGSANGEKFKLPISTVLTIVNNKIVRDATYYNNCQ